MMGESSANQENTDTADELQHEPQPQPGDLFLNNRNVTTGPAPINDYSTNVFYNGSPRLVLSDTEVLTTIDLYLDYLRETYKTIPTIAGLELPSDAVYVNLVAAQRPGTSSAESYVRDVVSRLAKQVAEDKQLSHKERQDRQDECARLLRSALEPQAEKLTLDQAVDAYPRLVILGEPGAGKTTLLHRLAYSAASKAKPEANCHASNLILKTNEFRLPLIIPLSYLATTKERDLPVIAANCVDLGYSGDRAMLAELFRKVIQNHRAMFLFDGLDEVVGGRRLQVAKQIDDIARKMVDSYVNAQRVSLKDSPTGNRMIITCRVASYYTAALSADNAHYVILGLTTDNRHQFLASWFAAYEVKPASDPDIEQKAKALTDSIKHSSLERLAEVPLLLTLIAYVWRQGNGNLPATRVELYAEAVNLMLRRRRPHPSDQTLERIIKSVAQMAFCLNAIRDSGTLAGSEAKSFLPDDLHRWWSWLRKQAELFVVRGSQHKRNRLGKLYEELQFGFPHRSFEEYFAALWVGSLDDEQFSKVVRRHLHDPRWDEVILLAFSYINLHEPTRAARLLDEICIKTALRNVRSQVSSTDGTLAQRLFAAIKLGWTLIRFYLHNQSHIGATRHDAYEGLLHRNLLFAVRATGAGVDLPDAKMQMLFEALFNLYSARGEHDGLEQGGGYGRYKLLHQQIDDTISSIVGSPAGKYLTDMLLKKFDSWLRQCGLLIKFHQPKDIFERLAQSQEERDETFNSFHRFRLFSRSRHEMAYLASALSKLGVRDERTVGKLLSALTSSLEMQSYDPVDVIVEALGELGTGDEHVAEVLLPMLKDKDESVRSATAEALGKLGVGNEQVIKALLAQLGDGDDQVGGAAAEAIGRLGVKDKYVVESLLQHLADYHLGNSYHIDAAITQALIALNVKEDWVIGKLLKYLVHEELDPDRPTRKISEAAARVLLSLGVIDKQFIGSLLSGSYPTLHGVKFNAWYAVVALDHLDNRAMAIMRIRWRFVEDSDRRETKSEAAEALAASSGVVNESVIKGLLFDLSSRYAAHRGKAAIMIGLLEVRDERLIANLLALLDSNSKVNNYDLIRSTVKKDENADGMRGAAFVALASLGVKDKLVVDGLLKLLKHDDEYEREDAAASLGKLGVNDGRVIAALVSRLGDKEERVREAAVIALTKLGVRNRRVITGLVSRLSDKENSVRSEAASALGSLGVASLEVLSALRSLAVWGDNYYQTDEAAYNALYTLVTNGLHEANNKDNDCAMLLPGK